MLPSYYQIKRPLSYFYYVWYLFPVTDVSCLSILSPWLYTRIKNAADEKYGARFKPAELIKEMAEKDQKFYQE